MEKELSAEDGLNLQKENKNISTTIPIQSYLDGKVERISYCVSTGHMHIAYRIRISQYPGCLAAWLKRRK